jgi:hypothetical protein
MRLSSLDCSSFVTRLFVFRHSIVRLSSLFFLLHFPFCSLRLCGDSILPILRNSKYAIKNVMARNLLRGTHLFTHTILYREHVLW